MIEGEEKSQKIPDPFGLNKKIYVYGADNPALATECIQYVAAFQELAESLGDSKLTKSQEENLHSLLNKIHTIQKKREDVFLDAIYEAVQKYKKSQIYFIVGFGHITNDSLCSKLAEKKIDYCALMPLNDKISSEQGLAYIDELKEIFLSDLDKE